MTRHLIWFAFTAAATVATTVWAIMDPEPFRIISIIFWAAAAQTWLLLLMRKD